MTEHIALYGKGGAGTSTLVSHLSAALTEAGFRVLQIGCSPKGDSGCSLTGGLPLPTVLGQHEADGTVMFDTVVSRGFKDVFCIELGGAAGERGSTATLHALDLLMEQKLFSSLSPDFVLYDISGDLSGEIVHTLREKVALHRIFAVTTADFKALQFINAVMDELDLCGNSTIPVPCGGLIPNGISSSFEESFIADFAKQTGAHVLGKIPRSLIVRQCELYGKTVIEASPLSNQSYFYRRLANQIVDESRTSSHKHQPRALSHQALNAWARDWADRLYAIENGLVSDGAAI